MAKKKGSWIVKVRGISDKEVICDNCTEEEARSDPFANAISEREESFTEYEVTGIEENI